MPSDRPDRIQIRASQLAAGDFPAVCAMTGRPAETWRKFQFFTPSAWVHLILLTLGTEFCAFGLAAYLAVWFFLSPKASGRLPLTRGSATRLNYGLAISVSLLPLSLLVIVAGFIVGNTLDAVRSRVGFWILLGGVGLAVLFVIGLYLRPLLGPGAWVNRLGPGETDRLIELKRVHPAFVNAVREMTTTP